MGKLGKKAIFAIIAAVLLAGGAGIFAMVKTGAFLSPSNKVLLATARTVGDTGDFARTVKEAAEAVDEEYTVDADLTAEGLNFSDGEMKLQFSHTGDGKQASGTASFFGLPESEFLAQIDAEHLKIRLSSVSDKIFVYDYRNEKTGYLAELFGQDVLERMDRKCRLWYGIGQNKAGSWSEADATEETEYAKIVSGKEDSEELNSFLKKAALFLQVYHKLEFTRADKAVFVIGDETQSCKGYRTTVTRDDWKTVLSAIDEAYGDVYGELAALDGSVLAGYAADLREWLENMPDTDVTFYLYGGQLAAISAVPQDGGTVWEIRFLGGDTRMQNLSVLADGAERWRVEGTTEGSVEKKTVFSNGEECASFSYDSASGDVAASVTREERTTTFSGNFTVGDDGWTLAIDRLGSASSDFFSVSGTVTLQNGASLQTLSGGEFDMGSASEGDWGSLLWEIMGDAVKGKLGR